MTSDAGSRFGGAMCAELASTFAEQVDLRFQLTLAHSYQKTLHLHIYRSRASLPGLLLPRRSRYARASR